ncbi:hypothetical protein [Lacticaseibacillus brantae]|uniref:hypothetical protein n=1 Tax=Lacticaseibacillus brantae TaxID=943673 RepID=UPI0012EEBB5A|nr:hypothetical protein [Lacticaseibacillus brantae]
MSSDYQLTSGENIAWQFVVTKPETEGKQAMTLTLQNADPNLAQPTVAADSDIVPEKTTQASDSETAFDFSLPEAAGQYAIKINSAILAAQANYTLGLTAKFDGQLEMVSDFVTLKAADLSAGIEGTTPEADAVAPTAAPAIGLGTQYPFGIATGFQWMAAGQIDMHQHFNIPQVAADRFTARMWTGINFSKALVLGSQYQQGTGEYEAQYTLAQGAKLITSPGVTTAEVANPKDSNEYTRIDNLAVTPNFAAFGVQPTDNYSEIGLEDKLAIVSAYYADHQAIAANYRVEYVKEVSPESGHVNIDLANRKLTENTILYLDMDLSGIAAANNRTFDLTFTNVSSWDDFKNLPRVIVNFINANTSYLNRIQIRVNDRESHLLPGENGKNQEIASRFVLNYHDFTGSVGYNNGSAIGQTIAPRADVRVDNGQYFPKIAAKNIYINSGSFDYTADPNPEQPEVPKPEEENDFLVATAEIEQQNASPVDFTTTASGIDEIKYGQKVSFDLQWKDKKGRKLWYQLGDENARWTVVEGANSTGLTDQEVLPIKIRQPANEVGTVATSSKQFTYSLPNQKIRFALGESEPIKPDKALTTAWLTLSPGTLKVGVPDVNFGLRDAGEQNILAENVKLKVGNSLGVNFSLTSTLTGTDNSNDSQPDPIFTIDKNFRFVKGQTTQYYMDNKTCREVQMDHVKPENNNEEYTISLNFKIDVPEGIESGTYQTGIRWTLLNIGGDGSKNAA